MSKGMDERDKAQIIAVTGAAKKRPCASAGPN